MTAMLLALFLYLLLKQFEKAESGWFACHGCEGLVRFDGRQFVHSDGQSVAVNEPLETSDPFDASSKLLTHRATPVEYPLGRIA